MEPHQERVVEEFKALQEKIKKLHAFLYGPVYETLDHAERAYLTLQDNAMRAYSITLHARLVHWGVMQEEE